MKRLMLAAVFVLAIAYPAFSIEKANAKPATKSTSLTADQIILEEYKVVRAEINLCLQNRLTILSLGFAAVGVLLGGGVTAVTRDKPQWLASAAIMVAAAVTSLYVCNVWIEETQRLQRASYHNYYLEQKIDSLFLDGVLPPLEWEHRVKLDGTYKRLLPYDSGTPHVFLYGSGAFMLIAFILLGAGMGIVNRSFRALMVLILVALLGLPLYCISISASFQRMKQLEKDWGAIPSYTNRVDWPRP